jgi:hypothetical protein
MGIKITDNIELPNQITISISGIWNWFRNRRIKNDLNNIKKWGEYGDYEFTTITGCTSITSDNGEGIDEVSRRYDGSRNWSGKKENGS